MIDIAEVGLVTSVGRDATTAFSSLLAGIARPKELPYFSVAEPELQQPEALVGHPIEALTEGFHLFGVWARLAVAALDDLIRRADLPRPGDSAAWSRVGLVTVLPDIRSERFLSDGNESEDGVQPFLNRIAAKLGLAQQEPQLHAVCVGRLGIVEALQHSEEVLRAGLADRIIVLAVDSMLDTLTLEWLASEHRIKSGGSAVGLMPGEAGAAMLLELPKSGHAAVRIRTVARQDTAQDEQSNEIRGRFLESVISPCAAGLRDPRGGGCIWVSDQNGEQWRAEELGYCSLYMADRWPGELDMVLPAMSIGDTGAASSVLAFCMATMALRDELAGVDQCLISGSSHRGQVAAALLENVRE